MLDILQLILPLSRSLTLKTESTFIRNLFIYLYFAHKVTAYCSTFNMRLHSCCCSLGMYSAASLDLLFERRRSKWLEIQWRIQTTFGGALPFPSGPSSRVEVSRVASRIQLEGYRQTEKGHLPSPLFHFPLTLLSPFLRRKPPEIS